MKTFKIGGVHPKDQKLSADKAIDTFPLPKQAIIPLSQHIGAPATPVVAKGDYVRVGQLIAKATGFMSANIHSPYSGTIEKIDTSIDAWGMASPSIFIKVEGDEWMPEINRKDDIIRKAISMDVKFDKFSEDEFYATYLMMVSDFKHVANDPHHYLAMAKEWLMDDDVELTGSDKVCAYLETRIDEYIIRDLRKTMELWKN